MFDVSNLKTGLISEQQLSANISTSSNNTQDGTGIVWVNKADDSINPKTDVLVAYDANDITKELWNSNQNIVRDSGGIFMKFSVPTIANGKVYVANSSFHLNAYGIIDTTLQQPDCTGSSILSLNKPAFSSSFSNSPHSPAKAFDGNSNTKWISSGSGLQWIGVDLGSNDSICNISLQWDSTVGYGKNFLLQVSEDSTNWNTVSTMLINNSDFNSINVKTAGRYVRMYATLSSSTAYSLKEFSVYGSTITNCNTPSGLTVNTIDANSAVIRWNPTQATNYAVNFKPESSSIWQTFTTTQDTLLLTNLGCATYYQYAVKAMCNLDSSALTQIGDFNTLSCNNCILPTRTEQADVGNVGLPGQGCFTDPNKYSIYGAGNDFSGTVDAFHFVYKDFNGDGTVEAKLVNYDQKTLSSKAGIMFRENLNADSKFVFLGLSVGKGLVFQHRNQPGGKTKTIIQSGYVVPLYLRIKKTGTTYYAYTSTDGQLWTLYHSATNTMPSTNINAGMTVSSGYTQPSVANFKDFKISSYDTTCGALPSGVTAANIGVQPLNGSACYYYFNRYSVSGSGSINSKKNLFFFVYQTLKGNKTLTVKVTAQDSLNQFNQAAVMIRWSTRSTDQNISLGLTSGNGAFFQYQGADKINHITYIDSFKAPYFLRLVKSQDSVYTGYISADSINWQKIGEVVMPPGTKTKFLAGMIVNSADTSKLSNVIFDGFRMDSTIDSSIAGIANYTANYKDKFSQNSNRNKVNLKVYPNPAKKNFTIDCSIPGKQNILVSIIGEADGRIFFTQSLIDFSGNYHKEFNEALMPKGAYLVLLRTQAGVKTQRLIKE